jgi:hypothetical protein
VPERAALVLDAGALIAYDRGDHVMRAVVDAAMRLDRDLHTSAAVVAQVWRGGARQARLARLLSAEVITLHALDDEIAPSIGVRCAQSEVADVVDAHIAVLADATHGTVLTSYPDDLAQLGVPTDRIRRI